MSGQNGVFFCIGLLTGYIFGSIKPMPQYPRTPKKTKNPTGPKKTQPKPTTPKKSSTE